MIHETIYFKHILVFSRTETELTMCSECNCCFNKTFNIRTHKTCLPRNKFNIIHHSYRKAPVCFAFHSHIDLITKKETEADAAY